MTKTLPAFAAALITAALFALPARAADETPAAKAKRIAQAQVDAFPPQTWGTATIATRFWWGPVRTIP